MPSMICTEAIDFYHDLLLNRHLSVTDQMLRKEAGRLSVAGRPVCSVLRPYFIEKQTYDRVRAAAVSVIRSIADLGKRLMEDGDLRAELDLEPVEEEAVQLETFYGAPDVSGRLDGFDSGTGEFHFVEYNADSPGGLGYGDALTELFLDTPILADFQQRYRVETIPVRSRAFNALIESYRRWGGRGNPNIAIVDWRGVSTYNEFLLFKDYFEKHDCRVRIAAPEELQYKNGRLYVEDFRIDLVYKRVVVAEFLEKFGMNHPMVSAVRDRAVCMVNGFGVQMLTKKGIFALLSDPAFSHSQSEHIPWTRKVRERKTVFEGAAIDLISFVSNNRYRLVLKPNSEYGGRGVILGWECDQQRWDQSIERALRGSYVVQQRVPQDREPYPSIIDGQLRFEERFFDLDPYTWRGNSAEGCGVR
ncbi:MAG TPA: circularly permuted type 2 ATP-grasp protein, partial [Acidobacteriota bacterium]